MAWKADGTWEPEDDDVGKAIAGTIDKGGPLMKQAQGIGMMMANRRGLANSSIAVGTAEGEVLKAATPIGTATAQNINNKNTTQLTGILNMQQQAAADAAAAARQQAQLASDEKLAKLQQTNALALQAAADNAALERQREQIAGNATLSAAEREAEMSRLNAQIAANNDLAKLDATTKLNLGELDAATSKANTATNAITQMQSSYLQSLAQLAQNEKIPSNVRQAYEESLYNVTQANIGLIQQISGQSLSWGGNTATAGPVDDQGNVVTRQSDGTWLRADGSTYAGMDTVTEAWELDANGNWVRTR